MVVAAPPPTGATNTSTRKSKTEDSTPPNHYASHLMHGGKLAFISHLDQVYTLRITRAGKLILTK